jgi:hypothetical protein
MGLTQIAIGYGLEVAMTGLGVRQGVQFVTVKGKRLAVLSAEDWEALIDWLETLEDTDAAQRALAQLKAAGGNRQQAGWSAWEELAGTLE